MTSTIQLLETVKAFHDQGKVKLEASELEELKRQTDELLRRSKGRTAMKVPEGFEIVLEKLKDASPEEAYELLVEFMKKDEEGDLPEKVEEKKLMDIEEDVGDIKEMEKDEKLEEAKEEKEEGLEDKKPPFEKKKDEKSEIKDKKVPMGDKKDDIMGDKGLGKPDFPKAPKRDEVLAQLKEKERNRERMKHMKDLKKKDEEDPSASEMGMEDHKLITASDRAKKVKVVITPEKNIVAHHVDYGPIFSTVPPDSVKKQENTIRRLANKIHGLCVYEGFEVAASKLGNVTIIGKIAGVDDDVETDHEMDVPPADGGITEEHDADADMDPETPEGDVLKENDTDHELTPTKVVSKAEQERRDAVRAKIKEKIKSRKEKSSSDITDEDDTDFQESKDTPSNDITVKDDTDFQESKDTPSGDTLVDGDVDFKTSAKELEESYKKLYASRAEKYAEKAVAGFIDKFKRCLKIASLRMKLNLDDNPYKAVSADILTTDDLQLSDGDYYNPMDQGTAVELIEYISDLGHDEFVAHLLSRAADLLEKSDEYLSDAESDLEQASPVPVPVEQAPPVMDRSASLRKDAMRGNFETKNAPATRSLKQNKSDKIRSAIAGSTRLARRMRSK